MRRALAVLVLAAVTLVAAGAAAQEPEGGTSATRLDIVSRAIFGDGSLQPGGWGEVVVRIPNATRDPVAGSVIVSHSSAPWGGAAAEIRTEAPFAAAAGATVILHLPVRVGEFDDSTLRVIDATGEVLHEHRLQHVGDNRTVLLDVAVASALGSALRGQSVGARVDPWANPRSSYPGATHSTVEVAYPMYDPQSGEPVLPRFVAGYARISAVLMRSDALVRLGAEELDALAGWLLGGGTLALVMARPEDGRHPAIVALCGGEVSRPSGGNLHESVYGASATYGLGEVHLLAFDPQTRPDVDAPWVHARMVDLLRRANERSSSILFRPGDPAVGTDAVRRYLDPNEGARWAIVLSALLLFVYAVGAGPVNFTLWRKRGRPLRALFVLPIASAAAFGSVVVVSVVAKGCTGRSRHLTVVEAGAGMQVGVAHRWRAFFVPSAREIEVRPHGATSVLGIDGDERGEEAPETVAVDKNGLRLGGVQMRPWETVVIREHDRMSLGQGIALVPATGDEVRVINRSGRDLRGLVLWLPGKNEARYLASLDDGHDATSSTFRFASHAVTATMVRGLPLRELNAYGVRDQLDRTAPGLYEAWNAIVATLPPHGKSWFPDGVPVLIAQLAGGEGEGSDTGLSIEEDRVVVRIVGWGGLP
jgi:hypothetical protein